MGLRGLSIGTGWFVECSGAELVEDGEAGAWRRRTDHRPVSPPPPQMAPSSGPPQQQPPVAQQPPAQGPPAQGSEAQLISFD